MPMTRDCLAHSDPTAPGQRGGPQGHFEEAMIRASYPGPDGRPRFIAIGPLDDRLVTVVFSPLGTEGFSLISLRPASRKERRLYEQG